MVLKTQPLAEALIERRSITPDDAGCQHLIAEHLEPLRFKIHHLPFGEVSNLLSIWGTHGPVLLFVGHTDVVPPGIESDWQSPPFEPTVRDGFLFGRGAADMKGSVAAFVTACERYVTQASTQSFRIGILLTSDEEGPATDGIARVAPLLSEYLGAPTWCLVGEPSSKHALGDTIRIGRRGSLTATLTVSGQGGHVAYPELVDNPAHRLSQVLAALAETTWDEGTADFPPTSFQITRLQTDTQTTNMVPGVATAQFNLRYAPVSDHAALIERIEAIAAPFGDAQTLHWQWHLSAEPFSSAPGVLRASVQEAVNAECGYWPIANTAGGTSDGRFIAPLGAEVVELGPLNATIHKVDECIEIQSLETLSQIYYSVLKRLDEHCHALDQ